MDDCEVWKVLGKAGRTKGGGSARCALGVWDPAGCTGKLEAAFMGPASPVSPLSCWGQEGGEGLRVPALPFPFSSVSFCVTPTSLLHTLWSPFS